MTPLPPAFLGAPLAHRGYHDRATGRIENSRAAVEAAPPTRVLLRADAELPPRHPAHGKRPVEGAPAAYICKESPCGLPVPDAWALRDQLAGK